MTSRRQTAEIIALVVLFVGITSFTIIGYAARAWLPPVASEHGVGTDGVIRYLAIATGAVLAIGTAAFALFLWRYGRGRPAASPQTSRRQERWWSLVPVVGMALVAEAGVLLKGLRVWEKVYGPVPEGALVVEVTAQQFEWIVRYPGRDGTFGRTAATLVDNQTNPAGLDRADPTALDDIVLRKRIHLPAGRPVYLQLRSRDVLHSFSVPAFRVKQDVVPGMVGGTQFVPVTPGRYEIACAQVCGMAHYTMAGTVIVQSPAEYEEWLNQQTGWLQ
jgi:cytochrome c oxidase subunit 2